LTALRNDLDHGAHHVAFVHAGGAWQGFHREALSGAHGGCGDRRATLRGNHLQAGVPVKAADFDAEWQRLVLDRAAIGEPLSGNCRHLLHFRITVIDQREFHAHAVLGVVLGFSLLDAHVAVDREQVGGQSTGQHDDDADVDELDAEFFPTPDVAGDQRGDQVDEQQRADEMAAGKRRDAEVSRGRGPPDDPALEIGFLHQIEAHLHLRQGAGENQHESGGETENSELQRGRGTQKTHE